MSSPEATPLIGTDRAFARFCRDGDPDALAEVFDATAPRLLVLAGHLLPGEGGHAEDLVQATFLAAIESAPRFMAGRPVMPWLVTILARRAANLRRGQGRRRRHLREADDPDALQELVATAPDPAELAADRELAGRVAAAIEDLQSPYREVLSLRLVHDLTPSEIAHTLGRLPGTVHAQLHRGAERLRGLLPAGVALMISGLLPAATSLSGVRAAVLGRAASLSASGSAATGLLGGAFSVIAMKKLLTTVSGLAALALLGFLTWPDRDAALRPDTRGTPAAPRTAGVQAAAPDAATDAAVDPDRTVTARAPDPLTPDPVTFTGRFVDFESGSPLAGVEVRGWLSPRSWEQPERPTILATTQSGPDGRFGIELPADAAQVFDLQATLPGRAEARARWGWKGALRPGAVIDSGDIELALGAELTLRVVDEAGRPVQGFGLRLKEPRPEPTSTDGEWHASGWGGLHRTDHAGLAGPRSVPTGTYVVDYADGTGHRFAGPRTIEVPRHETRVLVDLRATTPDLTKAVAGRVVDTSGQPLVGVAICARQPEHERPGRFWRSERSFGDGRFHIPGLLPEQGPVEIYRIGEGFEARPSAWRIVGTNPLVVEPGRDDIRVVVEPVTDHAQSVSVFDGRSGTPLERFAWGVTAILLDEELGTAFGRGYGLSGPVVGPVSSHPGGRIDFELRAGWDHLLTVRPVDPTLQPVSFTLFAADGGTGRPREVWLQPRQPLHVVVHDETGVPVPGSEVAILRPAGRRGSKRNRYARGLEEVLAGMYGATALDLVTDAVTTGADGRARLSEADDLQGCRLRVRGPDHHQQFLELAGVSTTADAPLVVVVEAAARVSGRVGPARILEQLGPPAALREQSRRFVDPETIVRRERPELQLFRLEDGDFRAVATAGLTADGRFDAGSMEAGTYRIEIYADPVSGDDPVLAEFTLQDGEHHRLDIDLRAHAPTRVAGRVTVDGVPPTGVCLLRLGAARVDLDDDGNYTALLWPGRYRPAFHRRDTGGADLRLELAQDAVLAPGETRVLDLAFHRQ